jgi:hypothetical protein
MSATMAKRRTSGTKIDFVDATGKAVAGHFEVSDGIIIVTSSDGRTKMANVDESMLGTETLAGILLLQMNQGEGTAD